MARCRFHHYAWGLLAYNLAVILGGAFVRASISGDGCGNHWPNCNGQLLPDLGQAKTLIEFSHRVSSGILLPLILGLVGWAWHAHPPRHPARAGAAAALGLTIAEALIGAWLVKSGLVAHDRSVYRAVVMPTHLVLTFLLLGALALTAWWGGGTEERSPRLREQGALLPAIAFGILAAMALGVTGALTALGDTLFPASSLGEGLRQDFAPGAHFLVGLRFYHPLAAIIAGLYLLLLAGLATRLRPSAEVRGFAALLVFLFLAQMGAGAVNLALLAPIWMQLVHLILADALWISLVLLAGTALAANAPQVRGWGLAAPEPGAAPLSQPAVAGTARASWRDYLALTKPRVISLLVVTTLAAMAIAAGGAHSPRPGFWLYVAVAVGLYMAAGAANAINMVLERDLDLRMGRTATRPTVTRVIPARDALRFALALMVGSFALLWSAANLLSATLAMAGLAFYVVVYTLLLKRRTWANIVIGGAAGAFPPLVGWAAVTGDLSPLAWCLFGIIFLWTPVHFWALALMIKEDYARAGIPMLPVVRGDRATVVQIAHYTILTVAISNMPLMLHGQSGHSELGGFYLATAMVLNTVLILRSVQLYRQPDAPHARSLFRYSMVYLALLFVAMAVDRIQNLMAQIFHPSTNVISKLSIVGVVSAVPVLGVAGYFWNMSYGINLQQPLDQPVPFSHKHHVGDDGIDCRYCHTSVDKAAFAGIPPTETCMTCHSQIWTDSPLLEPVRESYRTGRPLQWTRVHDLPDFVYFNHSIHIKKGIGCVSCHGRVDEMPLTWKQNTLTMAWCIDCHRDPEKNIRPRERVYDLTWKPTEAQASMGSRLVQEYHVLGPYQLTNCSTCHH